MKVLLTGASGYVGNALRKALRLAQIPTTLLSRTDVQTDELEQRIVVKDILKLSVVDWTRIIADHSVVIHCAWYVSHSDYRTSHKNLEFLNASLKLTSAIAQSSTKIRLVGIGTCLEYAETDSFLTTNSQEAPQCLYSACKLAFKNISTILMQNTPSDLIWCRLFYLYGGNEKKTRLYPLIKQSISLQKTLELGDEGITRDFLHVDEAAKQIIEALIRATQTQTVNICSGEEMTLQQFVLKHAFQHMHLMKFNMRKPKIPEPYRIVGSREAII